MVLTSLSPLTFSKGLAFFSKVGSSRVSFEVDVKDLGNSEELRRNENEDLKLGSKLGGGSKDEDRMEGDELFFKGGKVFSNCGSFEGLLLGLKTDSDFALDVRLDAIMVEVTIARLDFFLFGCGEGFTTLGSTKAAIFSVFSKDILLDASFVDE